MPRLAREDLETEFFHIIVQGINREYIFQTSEDIKKYLELIKIYKEDYNITIIAYCIMNNHAHILLHVDNNKKLFKFMHKINMIYAIYYNKKAKRVGYVFRDRYKSEPIYDEIYLLNCMLYIHMNPVAANLVANMIEYKYSSYHEYIGQSEIIDQKSIELTFGRKNYIEQFNYLHGKEEVGRFIDIESKDECRRIIYKFMEKENIDLYTIVNNESILIKLLIELKMKNGISYRQIEKEIGISREKLRRVLMPK
ncbi:MAG: transposase [Firmicutes bacterium]|nr:transposase [Bacillota bacterium]